MDDMTCDCWHCRGEVEAPEWAEVRDEDETVSWHGVTDTEPDPFEWVAATGEALAPLVATGPRYEPPPAWEVFKWVPVVCTNTLTSSLDD